MTAPSAHGWRAPPAWARKDAAAWQAKAVNAVRQAAKAILFQRLIFISEVSLPVEGRRLYEVACNLGVRRVNVITGA
jgi:hypothetical protein